MKVKLLSNSSDHVNLMAAAARTTKLGNPALQLLKAREQNPVETAAYVKRVVVRGDINGPHESYNLKKHDALAEASLFFFGIEGISRLAIEYLEYHRMAGYSEMSMRAAREMKLSSYMPEEERLVGEKRIEQYHKLMRGGVKAEEARKVVPMGVESELTAWASLRSLIRMCDHMIRADLEEVRDLGSQMWVQACDCIRMDP